MDDFDMLVTVKLALGVSGNYLDGAISVYIAEVEDYLKSAGVPTDVVGTQRTAGAVARGVADLWNYGGGDGKLSPYFHERVTQLAKCTAVQQ